ncbi:MAG: hypothetical protein JEY99_19275 [Spirochaetales bacterium]|nr:hypothetical protein [Spirochaetales bacterium]
MLNVGNILVKVAWYYYMDNLTQQQIAELLDIPRMRVVKLLSQAKDEGIIQFKINQTIEKKVGIENALIDKYSLHDAVVIPVANIENINECLSKAAASYIDEKAKDGDYINIGFGRIVSNTLSKLMYNTEKEISFVSLTGGVSYYTSSIIKGAHYRSSSKTTPNIAIIPAPLLSTTKSGAEAFRSEPSVKEIFKMNSYANMSVIGIGALTEKATIFKTNIANENDFQILKMKGAVGDLLSQFIDVNGNLIKTDFHDRLITTPLERLKDYQNTIAVSGGEDKFEAITAALRGNYINILITDEITAQRLIETKTD